jgi:UDP-glucose 4-epimerase
VTGRKVADMPKVLVTGGAGFIGSHVAELLKSQAWEVVVVDDLSTGKRENVPAGARFYKMDIRDPALEDLFERERPDFVSHHAAQMSVVRSVSDPAFDASVNILGLINLLQACVRHSTKRVVFASTGGALYGDPDPADLPCGESHSILPLSPYGITKAACEHYLRFFNTAYGLPYVSLRYGNVYGPRQDPEGEAGVVAIFCGAMMRDEPVKLYGRGEATRDYVHVRDVARANHLALTSGISKGSFNISSGSETSVRQIFEVLAGFYRYDLEPELLPLRPGEISRIALDNKAARESLQWGPAIELKEGLVETAAFFAQQAGQASG